MFKGNNDTYYEYNNGVRNSYFSGSTSLRYNVKGNIMSLVNSDNFGTQLNLQSGNTFAWLFQENKNIVDASKLLMPATGLTAYCYNKMFDGCLNMVAAPSILPATTLAEGCYQLMFYNCKSLTTAPELPATTLVQSCYYEMFHYCSSLNYIKCLATDISASYCTRSWIYGVSDSGTFVKNPNMTSWTTGTSGIPTGWTVIDNS